MMRRFLEWLTSKMAKPRVIYDRDGKTKYLSRWYLLGGPRMPDGSKPFTEFGHPKEGLNWSKFPINLVLHKFHRSDDAGELHSHPWKWACSLILAGGYSEERRVWFSYTKDSYDRVERRTIKAPALNFIPSTTFHRVDLLEKDAWSIFMMGPKFTGWGFWHRETGEFTPWKEFIRKRGT